MKKGGKTARLACFLSLETSRLTSPSVVGIRAEGQANPWDLLEQLRLSFTFSCIHARNPAENVLASFER